jgi:hypothetical protein
MTGYENLLTILILFGIFLIGYSRITNKNLSEMFGEIRELFGGGVEEIDIR